MTNRDIHKFIIENRDLLQEATLDQKIRLLKIIRESLKTSSQPPQSPSQTSDTSDNTSNGDYLDER